jgi:hypothetical protein
LKEESQKPSIVLQSEAGVELSHAMKDFHEQALAHPIAPQKTVGVCCSVRELVVVQHHMTLQPLPELRLTSSRS